MRKLLAILLVLGFTTTLSADTIYLTNGWIFHGIVTDLPEQNVRGTKHKLYRVFFGSVDKKAPEYKGYIDIEAKNVGSIVKNDKDSFSKQIEQEKAPEQEQAPEQKKG